MTDNIPNQNYSIATGTSSTGAFVTHFDNRDPNLNDVNYPVQKEWVNTTTDNLWILQGFTTTAGVVYANWLNVTSGKTNVETLTGNTGGAVGVDASNNINVVGDGTTIDIVGNPTTHTLTASTTGSVATTYTGNTGVAVPALGNLNVLGNNGVTVAGSGSTLTITGSGSSVDNLAVDAFTAPGTNPVTASGGTITITGGQVASGTTTNVIRTDSLAANTLTIQVQRSQAVASSTIGDNGVSHFNNSQFTVDSSGFVGLKGSGGSAFLSVHRQVFTATGTYTPTTGMVYCDVEVLGGGGGGGGTSTISVGTSISAGAGGAVGGYAKGIFSAIVVGSSQAITIGAGGTAGAVAGGDGGDGGTTSVGSLISATGGGGGMGCPAFVGPTNIISIFGGAGGVGTGGDFQTTGNPGGASFGFVSAGAAMAVSGNGGGSFFGGAAMENTDNSDGNGQNATSYGGGGSGARSATSITANTGGTGFAGIVIVTEYVS